MVDFVPLLVFNNHGEPVLIIDVKDDSWSQKAELYFCADTQMRDRYALILDDCPGSRLWGLSVLGTSSRVYWGDKLTYEVNPPAIPRPEPSTRLLYQFFWQMGGTGAFCRRWGLNNEGNWG